MNTTADITAEACERHNRQFGYAGNISAKVAWEMLATQADTVIVDVRTQQEWEQIGLPDLAPLGKKVCLLSWGLPPTGETSQQFVSDFSRLQVAQHVSVLLLCRSGGRSQAAACALTAAGYTRCFNIAGGFEGPQGWRDSQLPRKQ